LRIEFQFNIRIKSLNGSTLKSCRMETSQEGKNDPEGKGEKFFKEFGKKMDQFMGELKEAGDRAEVDFKQKFEELKKAGEKLKNEAGNKERWKEVETSLKKATQEFENALKAAFKKKSP
jgi:hypothetical protein